VQYLADDKVHSANPGGDDADPDDKNSATSSGGLASKQRVRQKISKILEV
jgi:hypothetical protein